MNDESAPRHGDENPQAAPEGAHPHDLHETAPLGHREPSPYAPPSGPPPSAPPAGQPVGSPAGPPPAGPPSYGPPTFGGTTTPLPTAPPPAAKRRSGRMAFGAGVVAASLVVGGAAGIGGAAGWSALHDDGSSSSSSASGSTSGLTMASDSGDAAPAADGSVEKVAQTVLPSVVELDVSGSGQQGQEAGSGSGIILDKNGLILTNDHVVTLAGAISPDDGTITVSFNDGTRADATVVGVDPLTDTALVQAKDVSGLTPATIGDSGKLAVGENVVAIGSPFGLDATVTSGIVSALDRPVDVGTDADGNSTTYPAIQTDAAINPGNSGGPLVDDQGDVVGINASIKSTSSSGGESGSIGLGFAIPINEVLPVIEQMKNGETPTHARLGVQVTDATTPGSGQGAEVTEGAEVAEVTDGSAAGSAGLQQGDVITKVDDEPITSSDSLVATIRSYRPGDQVTLTYERDGKTETTTLQLESDAGSTS